MIYSITINAVVDWRQIGNKVVGRLGLIGIGLGERGNRGEKAGGSREFI